jgi:DNA-binding response OmpR family regulator
LNELIQMYREAIRDETVALDELVARIPTDPAAAEGIKDIAHRLKGSGSSYGFPEITARAMNVLATPDAGIVGVTGELLEVLRLVAQGGSLEKRRVLVVEDDRLIRMLLMKSLTDDKLDVLEAGTLAEARQIIGADVVDVLLLDLFLPDGDGRRILVELRSSDAYAGLPIVVLSGSDSGDVRAECLALGADGYVEKPCDPVVLRSLVDSLVTVAHGDSPVPQRRAALAHFLAAAGRPDVPATVAVVQAKHLPDDPLLVELASRLGAADHVARWSDGELIVVMESVAAADAMYRLDEVLGRAADLETARAAVVDVHDVAELPEAIDRASRAMRTSVRRVALAGGPAKEDVRILVADDDDLTAGLVVHRLEREGYRVERSSDGREAFRMATTDDYSLVILDVKMPRIGGFELLERIRELPQYHETPIVMLTAIGSEKDVVRGFNLGASDYIVKPFSPTELTARVQRLLLED